MFFRHILTADAKSSVYDLVRVLTFVAFVVAVLFTIYEHYWVEPRTPFDIQKFGTGIGLILAAGGGAMWARNDKESRNGGKEDEPHA